MFSTQCICYDVRLSRVKLTRELVVLNELYPSSLPLVQLFLRKQLFQTLVISEQLKLYSIKIIYSHLKCKDDYY